MIRWLSLQTLNYAVFNSGLALLPMTVAILFLMVGVTRKLVARFGFKINLIAGLIALAASLLLFSTIPPDGTFLVNVLPASLLGALGVSESAIKAISKSYKSNHK